MQEICSDFFFDHIDFHIPPKNGFHAKKDVKNINTVKECTLTISILYLIIEVGDWIVYIVKKCAYFSLI